LYDFEPIELVVVPHEATYVLALCIVHDVIIFADLSKWLRVTKKNFI